MAGLELGEGDREGGRQGQKERGKRERGHS